MKDIITITCPVCGQHYLPSEIFMPDNFFGKQKEIVKTPSGEIDFYIGDDMDLDEEYVCDNCGSKLNIHANVSFNVTVSEEENFDEEYTTPIKKMAKLKLSEETLFND